MSKNISRRHFFNRSVGLGVGSFLFKNFSFAGPEVKSGMVPLIITSHTNETGKKAMKAGWDIRVGQLFTDRGDEDNGKPPANASCCDVDEVRDEGILVHSCKKRGSQDGAVHCD